MPNTVTARYRARDGDEHHAAVERPPMARWRVLDHAAAQIAGHPGAPADELRLPPDRCGGVASAVGGPSAARPNRGGTAGAGSAAPNRRRSMGARDRIEIEMPFLPAAIEHAGMTATVPATAAAHQTHRQPGARLRHPFAVHTIHGQLTDRNASRGCFSFCGIDVSGPARWFRSADLPISPDSYLAREELRRTQ